MKKISIIIPVYNAADYIAQTLDGIYTQTISLSDLEVICYLDACTDNSVSVIQSWMAENPGLDIRMIIGKKNVGPATGRNRAITAARGEFMYFMDADDMVNTGFYGALYNAACRGRADVAVASFYNCHNVYSSIVFEHEIVLSNPQDKVDEIRMDTDGYMCRYLIRRSFWKKHKLCFPDGVYMCEDLPVANRMIYAARRIITVPDAQYIYKYRPASLVCQSKTHPERYKAGQQMAKKFIREFMAQHNLRPHLETVTDTDIRLFGRIRIAKLWRRAHHAYYRLFGKILMIKTSSHIRYRPKKS